MVELVELALKFKGSIFLNSSGKSIIVCLVEDPTVICNIIANCFEGLKLFYFLYCVWPKLLLVTSANFYKQKCTSPPVLFDSEEFYISRI